MQSIPICSYQDLFSLVQHSIDRIEKPNCYTRVDRRTSRWDPADIAHIKIQFSVRFRLYWVKPSCSYAFWDATRHAGTSMQPIPIYSYQIYFRSFNIVLIVLRNRLTSMEAMPITIIHDLVFSVLDIGIWDQAKLSASIPVDRSWYFNIIHRYRWQQD